jgi:integrase/recombinase XerD
VPKRPEPFVPHIYSTNQLREHIAWCEEIRVIPFKKCTKTPITYLEKSEMDALLAAPNAKSAQGRLDHLLLLFLYNTGARADEVA